VSARLDPSGNAVGVGRSRVRTPGLTGSARALSPARGAEMRQAELSSPQLEAALAGEHVESQETIEISGAREVPAPGARTRSTRHAEPAIELEVPHPGEGFGQAVLALDESGVVTWNLPRDAGGRLDKTRGGATLTYLIRRHVPPADGPGTRGILGAIGKKLLKVVAFPLLDPIVGRVADRFAGEWERRKRPYGLRSFTSQDSRQRDGTPVDEARWRELAKGRTLVLVHGTFSRAHAGFGGMPDELLRDLHGFYEGRVIAFDHFTLSHDPRENADWLVGAIPAGADLQLDLLCHSRGGLVARVLAEKQSEISLGSRSLRVDRVIFVATPNAGTVLADPEYMGDLVDRYTTVLNLFPDNGVTEVLEAVITVVKQLAVGALGGLDGLQSMRPGGAFLDGWLNRGPGGSASYRALAADYEPASAGLKAFVRDAAMDRIFGSAANDLVVPSAGVYSDNGGGGFPIAEPHEFAAGAGVHHSTFFGDPTTQRFIREWLR
jgi:hypothetical protein